MATQQTVDILPDAPMKTRPWAHQLEDYLATRDMPGAAIHWDPRCGKSKVVIDTAAWLANKGEIDCALVVAPNGVHLNWTRDEIPLHWPLAEPFLFEWDPKRTNAKWYQEHAKRALKTDKFLWVSVNVEGLWTPKLKRFLQRVTNRRRVLLILDESHKAKDPKAKRTKQAMALGRRCAYKRILSATMVAQGPFDLWSQFYVLSPNILGSRFTVFKTKYGVFRDMQYGKEAKSFKELVEYQNLPELRRRVKPFMFVRKKKDCLDLPPRLYVPQRFVMSDEQRRVYASLRDRLFAEIADGEVVTTKQALTKLLRLQQVTRGYVTLDDGSLRHLSGENPAREAALELVRQNSGKSIVWCRFRPDVDLMEEAFRQEGVGVVRCDGSVPTTDRPALRERFREDPDARVWLGTAATGGEGIDLGSANLMVFYSHGYNLVERTQAMERNYGSSQKAEKIDLVDLVAANSVDEKALAALKRKEDLAKVLTPDRLKDLIEED